MVEMVINHYWNRYAAPGGGGGGDANAPRNDAQMVVLVVEGDAGAGGIGSGDSLHRMVDILVVVASPLEWWWRWCWWITGGSQLPVVVAGGLGRQFHQHLEILFSIGFLDQYPVPGTNPGGRPLFWFAGGGGGGALSGGTAGTGGNGIGGDGESAPISDDSNGAPADRMC